MEPPNEHLLKTGPPEFTFRAAGGKDEREAVARFRFEHFFKRFTAGYPGVDFAAGRVYEAHDDQSTHLCAFTAGGELVAVSSATPAALSGLPQAWAGWFGFAGLGRARLDRTVVSSRMVLHPRLRHTGLFKAFYAFILRSYVQAGFAYALHYCRPDMLARYELLGHRRFGPAFNLPAGQLRAPMLLALCDAGFLRRLGSPVAQACLDRFGDAPASGCLDGLDFAPALGLMTGDERLAFIAGQGMAAAMPDAPGLAAAVLGMAAGIELAPGQTVSPTPDEALFGLVLSGEVAETLPWGTRRVEPGRFFGLGLLAPGNGDFAACRAAGQTVAAVFPPNLVKRAAALIRAGTAPVSPWEALGLACADIAATAAEPPAPLISEENGICGTPSSTASSAS